jgi:hypothetical protein
MVGIRIATTLAVLCLAALGCGKPKAGDTCTKGKAACQDDKTELICQGGKFIVAPCKGPKGCAVTGDTLHCDISGNVAGDLCSTDDEGNSACTSDGKQMVSCEKGKYTVTPCRGPAGCKTNKCDVSLAQAGDPCSGGGYTCSVDRKAVLQCKDGKAVVDETCSGGKQCKGGEKVGCE